MTQNVLKKDSCSEVFSTSGAYRHENTCGLHVKTRDTLHTISVTPSIEINAKLWDCLDTIQFAEGHELRATTAIRRR